jgi:protein-S-isoprenylcysteine O-methyltransferase Ste14
MRATEFEFRYRSLIILAIYFIALSTYRFEHENVVRYAIERIVGQGAPSATLLAHLIFGVGAFLTFLAAGFRTWAAAYLQSNTVQDPAMHLDAIVADGPYRHLRNPLYLGAILLAFGLALLTPWPGFLIVTMGFTIFFFRLTGLEESKLEATLGESYREFCQRVPRLWPSLKARLPEGDVRPRWGQAILGELHMWGFFAGMAAFAITLRPRVAWWIVGIAVITYAMRSFVLSTRRKNESKRRSSYRSSGGIETS